MNALVISGGGSKGAFAGGIAEYLLFEKKKEYDLFVGTSTGALLVPFIATGHISKIKHVFTNVRHEDIFNVNPIGFGPLEEKLKLKISYLTLIRRIATEQLTFGESLNLRKLIRSNFTQGLFDELRESRKEVIIAVANLSTGNMEYKSSNTCGYDDFCDWMWASANVVPFMSVVCKDGSYYADGGFGDTIPIHEAVLEGATEIDVIVLQEQDGNKTARKIENVIGLSSAIIGFMVKQISRYDLLVGKLDVSKNGVIINQWFLPRKLTGNYLIFDSKEMTQWWQEGLEFARSKDKMN